MTYAAGAAHFHHLPMAKSIFQSLFEKFIAKMLRREVWGYWYLTSQSGIKVNPSIKELRKPWADPIILENIMVRSLPRPVLMEVFRPLTLDGLSLRHAL
jgi:hypothetical protein